MFEMKDEYLLGVEQIDAEHRKLFELTERAYQLSVDQTLSDKFDHIIAIFEEVRDYAIEHFAHEEAYMENIKYKRLFTQKMEHQEFINKMNEIDFEKIDYNQEQTILDLLNFLNDWLVNHILYTDMLIVKQ